MTYSWNNPAPTPKGVERDPLTGVWVFAGDKPAEKTAQAPAAPAATDAHGNNQGQPVDGYALWDGMTESWATQPMSREAAFRALSAYTGGGDPVVAGYGGEYRPVFNLTAFARQMATKAATGAADAAFTQRQAAVKASLLAATPAPVPKVSREDTLRKMLAANEASLATELAKRKQDRAEVARLRENCKRLRGDLGIKTPEEKLLAAIFG